MKPNTMQAGLALLLAGCAFALPAAAADETKVLYKCVDAKGVVSITGRKCAAGSVEAWHRDAQTEPKRTPEQLEAARAQEARDQQKVAELSQEVQRRVAESRLPDPPPPGPVPGSHLAGATNPPEGSQLAPKQVPDAPDPTQLRPDNCQAAQNFGTAVREKTWLGLTDDQTRRLFAWVADQCRVNTNSNQ